MATISKKFNRKGEVSYRIKVSNGYTYDGKQIIKSMTWKPAENMTKKQIEKELNRQAILFEESVKSGDTPDRRIKFKDLADEWLDLISNTKEMKVSTIERLKTCKDRTYKAIGNVYVDDVTYRHIQHFIVSLSKEGVNNRTGGGLSEKSQKHYLTFVSDVMKYAIKCGIIFDNPCKNVTVVKTGKKEREPYSLEEEIAILDRLKAKAPTEYRLFFMFLIYLGLRRGEALAVEWKDIDFKTGVCSIVRTSLYQNKNTGIYTTTPKTKGSCRCLKLPDELITQLKAFRKEQSIQCVKCGDQWNKTDRLFTTWNGLPMQPYMPYNWLKRFCDKENLPFRGIHAFRHAFATQTIVSGQVDIKTVSSILGHSQTSTTLNIYAHEVAQANAQAMNVVADLIEAKRNSA